jgi:hypothetical protein
VGLGRLTCWPVNRASSSSMLRSEELSDDGRARRGSSPAMLGDRFERRLF